MNTFEEDITISDTIIPYCIYYSTISNISRIIYAPYDQDGKFYFPDSLFNDNSTNKDWYLGAVFYAVRPDLYPIPRGMSRYRAEYKPFFPYSTSNVEIAADPTHIHSNVVSFITYYSPVLHTIPIFFYNAIGLCPPFGIGTDDLFIVLGNESPKLKQTAKQELVSPLYVMWKFYTLFDDELNPIEKVYNSTFRYNTFRCLNQRCVPDNESPLSFNECLVPCMSIKNQESYYTFDSVNDEKLDEMLNEVKQSTSLSIPQNNNLFVIIALSLVLMINLILILNIVRLIKNKMKN